MILHPYVTDKRAIKRFETLEADIEIAQQGRNHNFDHFVYYNSKTKSKVICGECGVEFQIQTSRLLIGDGCAICGAKNGGANKTEHHKQESTRKIKLKFKGILGFDKFEYTGYDSEATFYCFAHKEYFTRKYSSVMLSTHGCLKCGNSAAGMIRNDKLRSEFIARSISIFGKGVWGYGKLQYNTYYDHVKLWCFKCGEYRLQKAASHLSGRGCSACASSGYKDHLRGYLYYFRLEVDGQSLYKIGITNLAFSKRYLNTELENITLLNISSFDSGLECRKAERAILDRYKEFRYKGEPVLKSNGNTELFTKDVLGLDPDH